MRASARRISSMVVGSVRMASPSYKKKKEGLGVKKVIWR